MGFLKAVIKLALWVGAVLGVIAGVLRLTAVDVAVVGHNAMAPTMITGEKVLVWRHATPERGDIVICENPSDPSMMVVGRVIAEAGATVTTPRGVLEVNGHPVNRDYQGSTRFYDVDSDTTFEMRQGIASLGQTDHAFFVQDGFSLRIRPETVADGFVYLLGDNLGYLGQDSRAFGPVQVDTCVGQIFMRLEPVDDGGAGLDHGYFDILD